MVGLTIMIGILLLGIGLIFFDESEEEEKRRAEMWLRTNGYI